MSKKQRQNPYSISQNFLTSRKTIDKLISKTTIDQNDTVLEIGAGKGHITKALSEKSCKVISYEIDKNLYSKLKPQLNNNIKLRCGDFLKCKLPNAPYKVFANIPFSRTTEIIHKLTSSENPPTGIWLIVEKGAAKRFCGLPKDNLNSLLLKPFFDSKIIWYFSRQDFHPAPNTDVVMLEMKLKEQADIQYRQKNDFKEFLSHSIKNGIFGSRALLTKKQISTALKSAKLPMIPQTGDISYIQWLCLFRCWLKFGKNKRG
ncbi:MAG: 23S ribosomal RNA methyltransferase Erm [Ruminococcaceae bacterium]|nr:23S ribosomal RNA methyltransferase Erm [Oscillospiraceae bacterium]